MTVSKVSLSFEPGMLSISVFGHVFQRTVNEIDFISSFAGSHAGFFGLGSDFRLSGQRFTLG